MGIAWTAGSYRFDIDFWQVSEKALLILRDHTRGKDERIFIYEDDKTNMVLVLRWKDICVESELITIKNIRFI